MSSRSRTRRLGRGIGIVVGASVLAVGVFVAGRAYGVRDWRDVGAYYGMSTECHRVWRDLASGRVAAGQDVDAVIAATAPDQIERRGRYVELGYHVGDSSGCVQIVAKDGVVRRARATSLAWDHVFFDALEPGDLDAMFAGRRPDADETPLAVAARP